MTLETTPKLGRLAPGLLHEHNQSNHSRQESGEVRCPAHGLLVEANSKICPHTNILSEFAVSFFRRWSISRASCIAMRPTKSP